MGKLTIYMAMFNSYVTNYQRVCVSALLMGCKLYKHLWTPSANSQTPTL